MSHKLDLCLVWDGDNLALITISYCVILICHWVVPSLPSNEGFGILTVCISFCYCLVEWSYFLTTWRDCQGNWFHSPPQPQCSYSRISKTKTIEQFFRCYCFPSSLPFLQDIAIYDGESSCKENVKKTTNAFYFQFKSCSISMFTIKKENFEQDSCILHNKQAVFIGSLAKGAALTGHQTWERRETMYPESHLTSSPAWVPDVPVTIRLGRKHPDGPVFVMLLGYIQTLQF